MNEIRFDWDPVKAQINIEKHGVSFEEAASVFYNEDAVLLDDPDHSETEERFLLLGFSKYARMLLVCHCYRCENEVIRIISARKATRTEEKSYYAIHEGW